MGRQPGPALDHVILSGMFYAGYADCVRCFYCGVGLKHWVPTDDVWTEHVRWRPGCDYLRAVKGDDFIRETQRRLGIEPGSTGHNRGSNNRSDAAQTVPRQQQPQPTISTTTSSTPVTPSTPAATTTTSVNSEGSTSATTHSGSGQTSRTSTATPTTRTFAVATSGATSSSATPSSPRTGGSSHGGVNRAGASLAPSAAEERERLSRLQAENRALSQRLRCRVCRQAAIDTILMPCGHLVLCEGCAGSVTSCPLCHDDIRATAKVHMA